MCQTGLQRGFHSTKFLFVHKRVASITSNCLCSFCNILEIVEANITVTFIVKVMKVFREKTKDERNPINLISFIIGGGPGGG